MREGGGLGTRDQEVSILSCLLVEFEVKGGKPSKLRDWRRSRGDQQIELPLGVIGGGKGLEEFGSKVLTRRSSAA